MAQRETRSNVRLKRVYAPAETADGVRILVDRLWPRGLRKSDAAIDRWLKELAPSTELRQWFGHEPRRWHEFRKRYRRELSGRDGILDEVRALARRQPVTLLFAARDEAHNEAVVLRDLVRRRATASGGSAARR
jgi:uncharacterized protein YeaO (DUF488 family)